MARALATPRQDFAVLADPTLPASIDIARQNHAALLDDLDLQGRTLRPDAGMDAR